jgi:hypothetical protein
MSVAYIMSRFPKLTETFILYEIIALQEQGVDVALYPLWREQTSVMHPRARPLVAQANYDSPCEKANCFSGWMNRSNNDIIVEYFNNVEICGFGCENGNPFNSNRVKSLELNSLFSFE